jgi:hypothetical protein
MYHPLLCLAEAERLGYPFLKMRVNDDSPSSFPLLLQDQMGGDKVSCLAVSLLVLV